MGYVGGGCCSRGSILSSVRRGSSEEPWDDPSVMEETCSKGITCEIFLNKHKVMGGEKKKKKTNKIRRAKPKDC